MLQLLALLVSGIMVLMGPSEFTLERLSIFLPDILLRTSVTIFKLPRGNHYLSLCTHLIYWLEWTMIG